MAFLYYGLTQMKQVQSGILAENPPIARFLSFNLHDSRALLNCLQELRPIVDGDNLVIGLGQAVIDALGSSVSGLKTFQAISSHGVDIPSTPQALWCWLRGSDRGELFHQSRLLESLLNPAFSLTNSLDSFQYDKNRDLSGYEDGTENPQGDEALAAGIVQGKGAGLDGSSFVAVQQWLHDFDTFDAMETEQQDDVIGRHVSDNEEFEEAPESAHVKRSAQESFEPEAFMLRHSMPWSQSTKGGLIFLAFGKSFDAFEAVLNRMAGLDDGIQDALFQFTRPVSGSYFWCPPMKDGELDLSVLGI